MSETMLINCNILAVERVAINVFPETQYVKQIF